ncbi:IS3 family transposase [Desulfosporosinus fructosivorans]
MAKLCHLADIARSSYYKWINRPESESDRMNAFILKEMIQLYTEVHGIYGYRRMTMNINRNLRKKYNHKRIYRLMKLVNMKSVIRKKKKHYTPSTPQITAENLLNRQFQADKPNQKWLTDVTEFKLTNGQKAYLSAILDLGDRSIVSYVLGRSNNNQLVFETFDLAIAANPKAEPLFHSDRGFQVRQEVA